MQLNKRYQRHLSLDEIGVEGQKKLNNASVLSIGAGGLGTPALLYLAAAGVGHLGIVEADTIDESNLQRQIIYKTKDIGLSKAKKAKESLLELNPEIEVEIFEEFLNEKNAEKIFSSYDIIIDGTDNFPAKFLINAAAVKFNKLLIYGALQSFEGQVSVFNAGHNAVCYRCLYNPPKARIENCAENGVIGAIAGIVGIAQATQAIEIIVGHESFKPLINKLWTIDAKTMESKIFRIEKDISCPVCSIKREDIKLEYKEPICLSEVPEINIEEANKLSEAIWLDVREKTELDTLGFIPEARHLSLSSITEGAIPNIAKEKTIIIYCQRGRRSKTALMLLKEKGFNNIFSLKGGYAQWQESIG